MTTLRRPYARLIFQTKREHQQGANNALIFEGPPWYFEARVNYSISDEAMGVGTFDAEIYNVSDDLMAKIEPNGIVKVEAGYLDAEDTQPSGIFYGVVNYMYPVRKGPDRVWNIHATTMAPRYTMYVPYAGENVLIGDVITYLMQAVGGEVYLPPVAFDSGVSLLTDYTTTASVEEEFIHLIDLLSARTGRGYLIVPSVENAFSRRVVDAVTREGEEDALVLSIDESANLVYTSGISPMQGDPDVLLVPKALGADGSSALSVQVDDEITGFEYNMSLAFDSRVVPGMWIHSVSARGGAFRSLAAGTIFFTKSVQHVIGGDEWVTEVRGPILDSDLISIRRSD